MQLRSSNITTSLKVSSQRIYWVYLIYGQNQLIICHFKWISPKSLEEKEIRYSHHLSAWMSIINCRNIWKQLYQLINVYFVWFSPSNTMTVDLLSRPVMFTLCSNIIQPFWSSVNFRPIMYVVICFNQSLYRKKLYSHQWAALR